MARVMAYCINACEGLVFTKGLSDVDEPDLWVRTLDGITSLWIDVGEPAADRLKKSARQAGQVKIYSFNSKSDVWWQQGQTKFARYAVSIYRLQHERIAELASMLERTMDMSVTITGESAYVTTGSGELEVTWETLQ